MQIKNQTTETGISSGPRWVMIAMFLLFIVSATLSISAMRWDRWARYESSDTRWWKNLPGESYASYKAWFAWRKSWVRATQAAGISAAAVLVSAGMVLLSVRRGKISRWMIAACLLHLLVVEYFTLRWGPDFRHPAAKWSG